MNRRRQPAPRRGRPAQGTPNWSRRVSRMNRAQLAFTILAVAMICALVGATLSTPVLDWFANSDPGEQEFFTDPGEDLAASLRQDLEDDPDDIDTMLLLANLLANTNRLPEAIDWYEEILAREPAHTTARLDFAQSLASGGMNADAELQFNRVLEAEPDRIEGHFYLAELYRMWQPPRVDEAAESYQRVIELDSTTLLAERAEEELAQLGYATPRAATPDIEVTP